MRIYLLGHKEDIPYYLIGDVLVYGSERMNLENLEDYLNSEAGDDRVIYYQLADPGHTIIKVVPVQGILKKKECHGCYAFEDCFPPTGKAQYYWLHINDLMYCCHAKLSLHELLRSSTSVELEDI